MSAAAGAATLVASSASLSVPDHLRLRRFRLHLHPRPPPPHPQLRSRSLRLRRRFVLAVLQEDRSPSAPDEEARRYGLNGSAPSSGVGYDDAAVEAYLGTNGNGRGNGAAAVVKPAAESRSSAALVSAGPGPGDDERRRKERVEEIGREDAWFKQSGGDSKPEVNYSYCFLAF